MSKGIFLGAGASYEVGMPLVWEFTQTLRVNVLKRLDTKLFNFKSNDEFKKYFIDLLRDESLHYEDMVGELEKKHQKNRGSQYPFHGVLIQLIECIQMLLLEDQGNTLKLLKEKVKDYSGFLSLVEEQNVLNIFSLNHDIVIEEVCDHFNIPYKDGFFLRKNNYGQVAKLKSISAAELEARKFNFFNNADFGVNLIKLHGSLDIFAVEDKQAFVKVVGDGSQVGTHYQEIIKLERESNKISAVDRIRPVNELNINDDSGELQFFRRSLLTGKEKFKGTYDQIAPKAFFDEFKDRLETLDELVIIGYGFGDLHINEPLSSWLSIEGHSVSIYDPHRQAVPECFMNNKEKVCIINGGMAEFLKPYDTSFDTPDRQYKRFLLSAIRDKLKLRREQAS